MIGWFTTALRTEVLLPQTLAAVHEDYRCTLDPASAPLDTSAAELAISAGTTRPVQSSIGGGADLEHAVRVDLTVTDGDVEAGEARRDAIVLALVMRVRADVTLGQAGSQDGLQELSGLRWSVEYSPRLLGILASFAALTFVAEVDLRP